MDAKSGSFLTRLARWQWIGSATAVVFAVQGAVLGVGRAAARPSPEQVYQALGPTIDYIAAVFGSAAELVDPSIFDLDALAMKLGPDPAAANAYVRDEVGYQPYFGALRGAVGTLIAGSGNALDRSILLAELLKRQGFETEIAQGQLEASVASVLVQKVFEPPQRRPDLPEHAEAYSELLALSWPTSNEFVEELTRRQKRAEERAAAFIADAGRQAEMLQRILQGHGVELSINTDKAGLSAAAAQHFWTRYRAPGGAWNDLDPLISESSPATSAGSPQRTFPADSVPDDLKHRIKIVLTLRHDDGSGAKDTVLLESVLETTHLAGQSVRLANVPWPNPALNTLDSSGGGFSDISAFRTVIQGPEGTLATSRFFGLDGRVTDAPPEPGALPSDPTQGMTNVLEDLFGPSPSPQPAPNNEPGGILGQWVDFETASPGAPARSFRRTIIAPNEIASDDPIPGTVMERSHSREYLQSALFWMADVMPITGATPPAYLDYRLLRFLATREVIEASIRAIVGLPAEEDAGPAETPWPLLNWQSAMTALEEGKLRALFPGLVSYVDRPGLISHEHRMTGDGIGLRTIDLLAIASRLVAEDGERTSDPRSYALIRGIAGTTAEREVIVGSFSPLQGSPSASNAATLMAEVTDRNLDLIALTLDEVAELQQTEFPPAVKSEMHNHLLRGNIVITPRRAVDINDDPVIGWWSIDPTTGEMIGFMPGGRGNITEPVILQPGPEAFALSISAKRVISSVLAQAAFIACAATAGREKFNAGKIVQCTIISIATFFGVAPGPWHHSAIAALTGILFGTEAGADFAADPLGPAVRVMQAAGDAIDAKLGHPQVPSELHEFGSGDR